MTPRLTLRTKVLLLAFINAVLLAAALAVFARTQLAQDFGTLLLGESRERLTTVALQVARELTTIDASGRDALLARYGREHGVGFYLFSQDGTQAGGTPLTLPPSILENLQAGRNKSPLVRRFEGRGAGFGQQLRVPENNGLLGITQEPPFFSGDASAWWAVFRMPLRSRDQTGLQPGVLIMMSGSFFRNPFFFNLRPWFVLAATVVIIALGCWLPIVRVTTKSISSLSDATAKIAMGSFGTRVKVNRTDEIGQLGESFNRMAGQLEGHVNGQKRFLRDAAHELRSPLARMQAALGNIQECETEFSPESQRLLDDMREEIDLMSSLTGELLTFSREENQKGTRKLVPTSLAVVVARVVSTENSDGAADVRADVDPAITVSAHGDSLFRGLSNVVRNAIRYAGTDGPITIGAEKRDGATVVTVRDQGPGIPEEALELVFTPFYRIDVSRDRKTGGNGLGMSIARSCIETCRGTIYCRNASPGLEVIITLPA